MQTLKKRPYWLRLFHVAVTGQGLTGLGVVFMLQANIGLEPWSVLQDGLTKTFGMSFGNAAILVGVAAVVLALVLKETFGIGTIICVFFSGWWIDFFLWLDIVPLQTSIPGGVISLLIGLELLAISTWAYMRECLGSGSRDALMVALARRTGKSEGLCRSVVEGTVILTGWLLGGQVGLGTVIAMVAIGALIDLNFRLLQFDPKTLQHENLADFRDRVNTLESTDFVLP